jgi:hypothetical protein
MTGGRTTEGPDRTHAHRTSTAFTIFILLVTHAAAGLWDGQRKGLVIEAGLGAGASNRGEFVLVLPDLSIGYAPTNQLCLDVDGAAFHTGEALGYAFMWPFDHLFAIALSPVAVTYRAFSRAGYCVGAGATYCLRPRAPSVRIKASGGVSPYRGGVTPALRGGIGYEFGRGKALNLFASWFRRYDAVTASEPGALTLTLSFDFVAY